MNFTHIRYFHLSYLPPLMVYFAYGLSALTGIATTFFVKEKLGFSAEFLAGLAFWAGIPWTLKVPIGHLVDLLWQRKALLVYLGAALVTASIAMMIQIVGQPDAMRASMSLESWFVLAALLAPVGFVLQDAVADAMTVEAVPRVDENGQPVEPETRRSMNATVQTLGRVAIVLGGALVALVNGFIFEGSETLAEADKVALYRRVFELALLIPLISVSGVVLAGQLRRQKVQALLQGGLSLREATLAVDGPVGTTRPSPLILGGGLSFALASILIGLFMGGDGQEIIFVISFGIVAFLMWTLLRELDPAARATLLGTAIIIFCFRAVPGVGSGVTWWMIDQLHFDQGFLARLSIISSVLALIGLFAFRRFMGESSIVRIVTVLSIASFALGLPFLGMYYGLHEWTSRLTDGMVDARFIAMIDTALESPLVQVSMVPMLAWIANSAPAHLKATYFAVMASFTNLALTASQLGTKYLNQLYVVSREVVDPVTHAVTTPADYSQLGALLWTVSILTLALPLGAIVVTRMLGFKSE